MTVSRDHATATGSDVVEAMADPALLIDRDLVIRVVNAAYLGDTGRTAGELVGQDAAVALAADLGMTGRGQVDDVRAALRQVVSTRRPGRLGSHDLVPMVCSAVAVDGEVVALLVQAPRSTASEVHGLETEVAQLREALVSRATIDQAKGVLMARHACDADRAFELLTAMSNTSNVRLAEVAAAIVYQVQRGRTPADGSGPG